MLERMFLKQPANGKLYVEDVFSTYLYAGNSSTQTITNGIDLAGKGGMVWIKARTGPPEVHLLVDSARSNFDNAIFSNLTNAGVAADVIDVSSTGFSFKSSLRNESGISYASWTFREAPKFFDVVTYTGTGSAQNIAHSLGVAPGCIIVKRTDTTSNWAVYHRGLSFPLLYLKLNLTDAQAVDSTVWNDIAPTASVFSVGTSTLTNASGGTYVAYVFAHDAASDGIIQCGSFVGTGSEQEINLGWEPQFVIRKAASSSSGWTMFDNMRGFSQTNTAYLYPNLSNAESNYTGPDNDKPTATGFKTTVASSQTYIYIAIRRGPMKTPTSGTSVFLPKTRSGTGNIQVDVSTSIVPDAVLMLGRNYNLNHNMDDRLRGAARFVTTNTSNQEYITSFGGVSGVSALNSTTYTIVDGNYDGFDTAGATFVDYIFRRAPGFFDEVCYTGTGAAMTLNHNLGVAPELMIIKRRDSSGFDWIVLSGFGATTDYYAYLNYNYARTLEPYGANYSGAAPTTTTFSVTSNQYVNASGGTYVAYLFASCPGVSKVGSFTGNGSSQTINCGFAAGARFVMIKRTDSTGDWYVWDTARGMVAGNDPHLSLNSIAAEVTTDDSVDTDNTGFIVNQVSATNVNVNGASYIYLAIA